MQPSTLWLHYFIFAQLAFHIAPKPEEKPAPGHIAEPVGGRFAPAAPPALAPATNEPAKPHKRARHRMDKANRFPPAATNQHDP